MAWCLKQRSVPCFRVESESQGGSEQNKEMEERRTADLLQGRSTGAMENKNRRKRRELCLSLLHSSVSTSDSHSPRALLSRLLLSIHKPSPAHGDGRVKGLGCRMRLPRHCSNKQKEDKKGGMEVMGEEKEPEVGGQKVVDSPMLEPPASAPPPPDSTAVEGGTASSGEKGRKPEEVSLNQGMVIGLAFLLTRSAAEFNKMVELREQMEMLVKDIKDGIQRKEVPPNHAYFGSSASNSFGNGKISNSISLRNDQASYHMQRLHGAMESKCDAASGSKRCLKTDQMERELEVELEHLQLKLEDRDSSAFLQQDRMELTSGNANPSESFSEGSGAANEVEESSSSHHEVNPRELERRLHELLQTRQQERIAELESALDHAERMIHEKEREISWWRDTTRLASQHEDETVSR